MTVINMSDFKTPDVLPAALTSLRSWLVWRLIQMPGQAKPRKVPHYPVSGQPRQGAQGSAEDREGLVSYERAIAAVIKGRWSGVGLAMLAENGIVAIDFDDCVKDGEVDPRVTDLCEGTYSEISPSGNGVRAFFKGSLQDRKDLNSDLKVEFFFGAGYVTVTGNVTPECALWGWEDTVAPLPQKVRDFYMSRFGASGGGAGGADDDDDWLAGLTPKIGLSLEKAATLVNAMDPECGYDDWLKVGQSLHHEFDGSEGGLAVWREWSRKSSDKYPGDHALDAKWESFGRYRGRPLTAAWLLKHSKVARVADRYEAVEKWKADITSADKEIDLREKVAAGIARDKRLDTVDRETLAVKLQEAFRDLGTKLPLPMVRKLVAPAVLTVPTVMQQRPMTEFGNVQRMLDRFGQSLMYVPQLDCWYVWSGVHWNRATQVEIEFYAKETINDLKSEAAQHANSTEFWEFCRNSQGARMVRNMVSLAASDPSVMVPAGELDKNRDLVGVRNGVLNLRTGVLVPPDPSLRITKSFACDYVPGVLCPTFEKAVRDAFFEDEELAGFLQRLLGYIALGQPTQDVMVIALGDGANGKSTIFNSVRKVMGDYARNADPVTFLSDGRTGNAGGAREDLLRLRGARFLYVNEPDEGGELREGTVKSMTGGDVIAARGLYARETVEIEPTWTIIMPTNHKPIIKGSDNGIWRRLLLVPFLRNFEKEGKADPTFKEKVAQESEGILNYLIQGVNDYLKSGLNPPRQVKAASESYRTQMDVLNEWLEEKCEVATDFIVESQRLWLSWEAFARERGTLRFVNSAIALGRRLDQRFPAFKGSGGVRCRKGLKLKRSDQNSDDFF